jgi:predicted membrane protein
MQLMFLVLHYTACCAWPMLPFWSVVFFQILYKCVFSNAFILLPQLLVVNLLLVSCYYLHNGYYYKKEGRLLVGDDLGFRVDDLDFKVRDVAFEAKVLNSYDTFDQIVNRTMEDPSYTYLHYDLLDRVF